MLRKAFEKMGFPVKINPNNVPRLVRSGNYYIIVTKDRKGKEQFLIGLSQGTEMVVLDKQLKESALLVLVNDHNQPEKDRMTAKFLLGHDERQLLRGCGSQDLQIRLRGKTRLKAPSHSSGRAAGRSEESKASQAQESSSNPPR